MKQTVNFSDFRDAFRRMDRLDNFSREGAQALFDYLEEIDPDMELDVIALCCDYTEADAETIAQDYDIDISSAEGDEEQIDEIVEEYLNENTSIVAKTQFGFLYANF